MVKISSIEDTRNNQVDYIERIVNAVDTEHKKDTQINIRLESEIANIINKQAIQTDTTKTDIITNIITEFYKSKHLNKGTIKLKKPVTLMIPKKKELITAYGHNLINIISDTDNSYDPVNPLKKISTYIEHEKIKITHANNILDTYDTKLRCFYDPETKEHDKYLYHKGLLIESIQDSNNEVRTIIIELTIKYDTVITAYIISKSKALDLAKQTKDNNIIKYMGNINQYHKINCLIDYDKTNKELTQILKEKDNIIHELTVKNEDLTSNIHELNIKLETLEKLNIKSKNNDTEYIKALESQNKELKETNKLLLESKKEYDKQMDHIGKLIEDYKRIMKTDKNPQIYDTIK